MINGGSPVGPGFVVYERAHGQQGYDLEMALASVGPGWADLIRAIFTVIDDSEAFVIQVKEKFGTLRVYVVGGDDHLLGYISGLETASGLLCENCGARGRLRKGGWIRTLCDSCHGEK